MIGRSCDKAHNRICLVVRKKKKKVRKDNWNLIELQYILMCLSNTVSFVSEQKVTWPRKYLLSLNKP